MREETKDLKEIAMWFAMEQAQIIQANGKGEYDQDGNPTNEAGRLLRNLRKTKKRKEKELKEKQTLRERVTQVRTNIDATLKYKEEDLQGFDPLEQAILRVYFTDLTRPNGEIADHLKTEGVTQQLVTSLLERPQVKDLVSQLIGSDIGRSCQLAIARGCRDADPKFIALAAEFGLWKTDSTKGSCDHTHSKPIDDPELMKGLQMVGDWLSIDGVNDIMDQVRKWSIMRNYDLVLPAKKDESTGGVI